MSNGLSDQGYKGKPDLPKHFEVILIVIIVVIVAVTLWNLLSSPIERQSSSGVGIDNKSEYDIPGLSAIPRFDYGESAEPQEDGVIADESEHKKKVEQLDEELEAIRNRQREDDSLRDTRY